MPFKLFKAFGPTGSKRLLMTEMVITATNATASLYIVWQHSIGLTQAQVNTIQATFTLILLFFTFPSGWVADRLSRKWSNAGGDFVVGAGFVGLTFVNSFTGVLVVEIVQGLGYAFTKGADGSMLAALTKETSTSLEKARSLVGTLAPITQAAMLVIGGYFGAINYDYMFLFTSIPFFVGMILSLLMKESGVRKKMPPREDANGTLMFTRRVTSHVWNHTTSEVKGMWQAARSIVTDDPALRWLMTAHAIGFKLYMPVVLVYGPLLLGVSGSVTIVVVAYFLRLAAKSIGAQIVKRVHFTSPPWIRFMLPSAVFMFALGIMLIPSSTIAIIVAMMMIGVCEGWFDVVTSAWVLDRASSDVSRVDRSGQEITSNKQDLLSSVDSMSDTFAQAVYAILLFGVAIIAGDDLRLVIITTVVVGLIALPVITLRLRRLLPHGI